MAATISVDDLRRAAGDSRPKLGFPTDADLRLYIKEDIFKINQRRHRYTQGKTANIIVLSRNGVIHGHFEVQETVQPPNANSWYDS